MIDPSYVTDFNRDEAALEEFLLFCCMVAGKRAVTQAKLLEEFLESLRNFTVGERTRSPMQLLRDARTQWSLHYLVFGSRLGQYGRINLMLNGILDANLDLRICTVDDLETIHGIGPKTARYFILHSRPNQQIAVLDRHILKHLASLGHNVPKSTPASKKRYMELERIFIDLAAKAGKSIADYDLSIWKSYSVKQVETQTI